MSPSNIDALPQEDIKPKVLIFKNRKTGARVVIIKAQLNLFQVIYLKSRSTSWYKYDDFMRIFELTLD